MDVFDGARDLWRKVMRRDPLVTTGANMSSAGVYERLYESHGRAFPDTESIGGGDFDLIGRLELRVLEMEGLAPTQTLVDFGCGTGRLAVHAVRFLAAGRYVGIDIAESMLERAMSRVHQVAPSPSCDVSFIKQTATAFPLPDASVDWVCAFSVFTHMEHEDSYRYLCDARRIVRPTGRFVLSCLPIDTIEYARHVFRESAKDDLETRWSKVRNVATSTDMIEAIARMAGWTVGRWYDGNARAIDLADGAEPYRFGQSICVLHASPGS
jgi:ubiquinone/menaquinone biosynthesis C-methylase UbiE